MSINIALKMSKQLCLTGRVFYVGFSKIGGGSPLANFAAFLGEKPAENLAVSPKNQPEIVGFDIIFANFAIWIY